MIGLVNTDPIKDSELKNLLTTTNGQYDEPFTRNLTGQMYAQVMWAGDDTQRTLNRCPDEAREQ